MKKQILPSSDNYELLFSDNGGITIAMGISRVGGVFGSSDAELMNKFLHVVHEREYKFDINTGTNKELHTLMSHHRLAQYPHDIPHAHSSEVDVFGRSNYFKGLWKGRSRFFCVSIFN